MLKLKELYKSDINRPIQNVIKISDDQNLVKQELEEYVLTKELKAHFNTFFSSYNKSINNSTDEIGVWISGFYGSGKSHLLKIISYLLDNAKTIDDKYAVDYFNDKINDSMLLEDIKRAGNVSADIILFNISSVAGVDTVTQKKDQILTVFEKTFNEKIGLCSLPKCAEFERYLINQGKYEEFQDEYKNINGLDWKRSRRSEFHRKDRIRKPYAKVMGISEDDAQISLNEIDKDYENNISIDYFTNIVKEYLDKKGNNHHIVFLVDEIGQYMEDDTSLMLNLQTIVEDLGKKCDGRAWVVVTSQEAIDKYTKVKGMDFSKILARFNTRLNLTSSDIEEVIKKRLLEKKEEEAKELEKLYADNEISIRNLIEFRGGATQKKYNSAEDFADVYPFIPYQFTVLQEVFDNIRKYGYTGKSVSRGERTLLKSTQETACKYNESSVGAIVPLYAFYDSVEEELDSKNIQTINKTKEKVSLGKLEEFDVNVLELLFMLKNLKEVPANIENITTLCISNINDSRDNVKKMIIDSLRRLENETLIQKNNDEYQFLTDEEQEINKAINGYHVQQSEIREFIGDIIYNENYPNRRFTKNKQNFDIAKFLDEKNYGYNEGKIGIKIFTDEIDLQSQSAIDNGFAYIKLTLPLQTHEDIKRALRIHAYRQDKRVSSATSERMTEILALKSKEETDLRTRLKINIMNIVKEASIYISGTSKDIKAKDFASRVEESLGYLVSNIYSKFDLIKVNYSADSIRELWKTQNTQMSLLSQSYSNQDAYNEVLEYCELNAQSYNDLSIFELVNHFNNIPYGFLEDDTKYIIALLLKNEKISLFLNNRLLDVIEDDTLNKILKKDSQTIIKMRKNVAKDKVDCVVNLTKQVFKDILPDDEDGIRRGFIEVLRNKKDKLQSLYDKNYDKYDSYEYPGKETVKSLIDVFNNILAINDINDFFDRVNTENDLIREKMSEVERIEDFFENQRDLFDKARDVLNYYNRNLTFIKMSGISEELDSNINKVKDILTDENPYSEIPDLKDLRNYINDQLIVIYDKAAEPTIHDITELKEYMVKEIEKHSFNDDKKLEDFVKDCDKSIFELQRSQDLGRVHAYKSIYLNKKEEFDDVIIEKINAKQVEEGKETGKDVVKTTIVHPSNLIKGKEYTIKNEEDINEYLNDIKQELISKIKEGETLIIK